MAGLIENTIEENEEDTQSDEFLEDFFEEAKEHIENIEVGILNLERDMTSKKILNSIFRSFHTIKGLSGFVSQENIEKIAHSTENILVKIRKSKLNVNKIIVDRFLDSIDFIKRICFCPNLNNDKEFLIEINNHLNFLDEEENLNKKLGEILKESRIIDEKGLEDLLVKQKENNGIKLGELAVKENLISAKDAIKALREQDISNQSSSYIKIPVSKIDDIINLSGELMILHSQVGANESENNDAKYVRMEKLIKDIQKSSMSLRMISLKSTFQKLIRIERDTSRSLNKIINLYTLGEDTEIDRNIAENILEPLSHLLKNAIYHGIEEENERVEKGKTCDGKIEINAYSKRGIVFIDVKDDGKGLDIEKIYRKAIEKELINSGKNYTDKEIAEFIFLPGFSTVENTDTIAGRGVGLDVVRESLGSFGGKVEIDFEKEKGTTFRIKIPINLASINGTIVKISDEKYIIPTVFIKEIEQWNEEKAISIAGNKKMIKIRNKIINIIENKFFFEKEFSREEKSLVIILEQEDEQRAILVDEIIDRREIVVKPLGEEFGNIKYVSGASILGDGKIALILDVENMFKMN